MGLHYLPLILLFGAFVPGPAVAAVVLEEIPVRVYDSTRLTAAMLASALETARVTLGRAGAPVAWRDCMARDRAACLTTRTDDEFVLRIVRSGAANGSSSDAAELRTAPSHLPLGDAYVDLGSGAGVLATIYLDRVAALAQAAGANVATLLGFAIAHEIGHLLIGSDGHSLRGLMRAVWSRDEVRRGRAADWTIGERDAAVIRTRVQAMRVRIP